MSIFKRLPWVSLGLLLLTDSNFGWVISKANAPPFVWLLAVIAVLLLIGGLTTPWAKMTDYSIFLFRSNIRSFGITILWAFLFFLMVAWFRVFIDTLVIIAAAILARIDFQAAGFNEKHAFVILSIFSLTGLALGALVQKLM